MKRLFALIVFAASVAYAQQGPMWYIPTAPTGSCNANGPVAWNGTLTYCPAGTWTTLSLPLAASSFTTTGSTPGALSLTAGSGSVSALPANSAGFAAPATGGTAYLFKLPATATAGALLAAAPATGDGVNESALTISVNSAVTSATGGSGTGTVTCLTANCTNLSGTYSVAGGTFTTGNLLVLVWPTTTTAYKCWTSQNGGTAQYGIGHSVATATGMTLTAAVSVVGVTVTIDYGCSPL